MTMRTLKLVVEVHQPEANWLWKSHQDGLEIHGVYVKSLTNGDIMEIEEEEDD
jgi:hypothetical protein